MSEKASPRARAGTTVDELYLVLRERIIDGTYAPTVRMSQDRLASELEVSRTPIREALRRLESEGFLVATANRGMEVAKVANGDTEQHYAARLLLEPPTLSALLDQVTDSDKSQMNQALDTMARSLDRMRDFQEAHRRFHDVALERYPTYLGDLVRSLHTMIYRRQRVYFSRPSTPVDFVNVDRMLLDAIRGQNLDAVRQLLEFHLIDATVGMVLDDDPDHRFDSLLLTTRGLGIEIDAVGGRIRRPAHVRWARPGCLQSTPIKTSNLIYDQ